MILKIIRFKTHSSSLIILIIFSIIASSFGMAFFESDENSDIIHSSLQHQFINNKIYQNNINQNMCSEIGRAHV